MTIKPVNRSLVGPFLLRVYFAKEKHHSAQDYDDFVNDVSAGRIALDDSVKQAARSSVTKEEGATKDVNVESLPGEDETVTGAVTSSSNAADSSGTDAKGRLGECVTLYTWRDATLSEIVTTLASMNAGIQAARRVSIALVRLKESNGQEEEEGEEEAEVEEDDKTREKKEEKSYGDKHEESDHDAADKKQATTSTSKPSSRVQVIGEVFVHGLTKDSACLGRLPGFRIGDCCLDIAVLT